MFCDIYLVWLIVFFLVIWWDFVKLGLSDNNCFDMFLRLCKLDIVNVKFG